MPVARVPRIRQPAAAMLLFGYLAAFIAAAWCFFPDYGTAPTVSSVVMAQLSHPFFWLGLALAWAADVVLSNDGQLAPSGRGIWAGRFRFFHGPVVTGVLLSSFLLGLWSTLASGV